jgi:hypothetical protein
LLENNFLYNLFNIIYAITMCWSWEVKWGIYQYNLPHKEFPGGCWSTSNQYAWGSIIFEEAVLGDTVDTAPSGFFLHYIFRRFFIKFKNIKFKNNNSRVLFMKHLNICPKCDAKLKLRPDGETQYCSICSYWTKLGTARLDSIMIYG